MLIAMIPFVFHGDRDTTVHPNNGDRILKQSVGASTQKEAKRGRVPGGRTYTRTILTEASGRKIPRALESKALATRGREVALRAPIPIREARTRRGRCCVSSSNNCFQADSGGVPDFRRQEI